MAYAGWFASPVLGLVTARGTSVSSTIKVFLPLVLRNQYEDKERQEEILRRSSLEWVIVRPAQVTNKRATGEYQVFLSGDSYKATTISREDVADFMLAQLTEDRYVHKTPVISY